MLEFKWIDIPHLLLIFNLQKLFMCHQSRLIRAISICQICENTLAFFLIHFAGKSIETSSKVLEAHTFSLFKIKVEKCISKNFKSFLDSLTKHFKKLLKMRIMLISYNSIWSLLWCFIPLILMYKK